MFNGWNTRAKREIEAKASVSRMVFLIYALGSSVKGLECHKWLELLSEKEIKLPDIRILSSGRYEKDLASIATWEAQVIWTTFQQKNNF